MGKMWEKSSCQTLPWRKVKSDTREKTNQE